MIKPLHLVRRWRILFVITALFVISACSISATLSKGTHKTYSKITKPAPKKSIRPLAFDPEKENFVEIELKDQYGEAYPHVPVIVNTQEGATICGWSDENGSALVPTTSQHEVQITFPTIDSSISSVDN